MIVGIDCGYRTGGVAFVSDDWSEVHDLPTYDEGGVDVTALMDILTLSGGPSYERPLVFRRQSKSAIAWQ